MTDKHAEIRQLVENFYDLQHLRVETWNRVVSFVKENKADIIKRLKKLQKQKSTKSREANESHVKIASQREIATHRGHAKAKTAKKPIKNLRAESNVHSIVHLRAKGEITPIPTMRANFILDSIPDMRAIMGLNPNVSHASQFNLESQCENANHSLFETQYECVSHYNHEFHLYIASQKYCEFHNIIVNQNERETHTCPVSQPNTETHYCCASQHRNVTQPHVASRRLTENQAYNANLKENETHFDRVSHYNTESHITNASHYKNVTQHKGASHLGRETRNKPASHSSDEDREPDASSTKADDTSQDIHESHHSIALKLLGDKKYSEFAKRFLLKNQLVEISEIDDLVWFYRQLHSTEVELAKRIELWSIDHPLRKDWLNGVKGIGAIFSSGLIAWLSEPIIKAEHVSSIWSYCGLSPQSKRVKGEKLNYNPRLRTFCWKIGQSFIKYDCFGRKLYLEMKEYVKRKHPDWTKMHIHNSARLRTTKIFIACLWEQWRRMNSLPVTAPFPMTHLGHDEGHLITPDRWIHKTKEAG